MTSVSVFPYGTTVVGIEAPPGTVTVSGETVDLSPNVETAGIRFNSDGTVDRGDDGTWSQVDISTDWIIPNNAASSAYDVKATITSDTGGSPGLTSGTTGSWLTLGTTRAWTARAEGPTGSDSKNITLTIEVSDDGGSTTLDSASYILRSGEI